MCIVIELKDKGGNLLMIVLRFCSKKHCNSCSSNRYSVLIEYLYSNLSDTHFTTEENQIQP